jgi:hypothetical protein
MKNQPYIKEVNELGEVINSSNHVGGKSFVGFRKKADGTDELDNKGNKIPIYYPTRSERRNAINFSRNRKFNNRKITKGRVFNKMIALINLKKQN